VKKQQLDPPEKASTW